MSKPELQIWLVVAQFNATAEDFIPIAVLPESERAVADVIARDRLMFPGTENKSPCVVVQRTSGQVTRWMMNTHFDIVPANRRVMVDIVLDDGKGLPAAIAKGHFDDDTRKVIYSGIEE